MPRPRPGVGKLGPIRFDRETPTSVRGRASTVTGGGELVTVTVTAPTRDDVERALTVKAATLAHKPGGWGPDMPLRDAVDAFIEARRERLRPQSHARYVQVAATVLHRRVGGLRVGEVTPVSVASLMETLRTGGHGTGFWQGHSIVQILVPPIGTVGSKLGNVICAAL